MEPSLNVAAPALKDNRAVKENSSFKFSEDELTHTASITSSSTSTRQYSQITKRHTSEDIGTSHIKKFRRLDSNYGQHLTSPQFFSLSPSRTLSETSTEHQQWCAWPGFSQSGSEIQASQAGMPYAVVSKSGFGMNSEFVTNTSSYHDEHTLHLDIQKLKIEHPLGSLPWCKVNIPRSQADLTLVSHDYTKENNCTRRIRLHPNVTLIETYGEEYDRSSIVNKESLASLDTLQIYLQVMDYKINEMEIHYASVDYTNLHLSSISGAERETQLLILERLLKQK